MLTDGEDRPRNEDASDWFGTDDRDGIGAPSRRQQNTAIPADGAMGKEDPPDTKDHKQLTLDRIHTCYYISCRHAVLYQAHPDNVDWPFPFSFIIYLLIYWLFWNVYLRDASDSQIVLLWHGSSWLDSGSTPQVQAGDISATWSHFFRSLIQ